MSEKAKDKFSVTVEEVRNFVQPSPRLMKGVLSLQRAWHRPAFFGVEQLDASRPALFVGNHTIYGVLDMPLFINGLHQKGILVRGLADRGHFMVPGYRDLLSRLGAVVGTRENCSALMTGGAHVLVYPGGAREVFKRKGEAYRLIWKERLGFVRMAVEHGYPIVPFGAVGAEDCYDVLYDGEE